MRSGDSDLEDGDDSSSDDDQAWTKEVKKEHKNIQVTALFSKIINCTGRVYDPISLSHPTFFCSLN